MSVTFGLCSPCVEWRNKIYVWLFKLYVLHGKVAEVARILWNKEFVKSVTVLCSKIWLIHVAFKLNNVHPFCKHSSSVQFPVWTLSWAGEQNVAEVVFYVAQLSEIFVMFCCRNHVFLYIPLVCLIVKIPVIITYWQ